MSLGGTYLFFGKNLAKFLVVELLLLFLLEWTAAFAERSGLKHRPKMFVSELKNCSKKPIFFFFGLPRWRNGQACRIGP
jgi:hypothetical protein